MLEPGDKVYISGAETNGMVDAVLMDFNGVQYRVVFWRDGQRRIEWCYPPEIKATGKKAVHI